MAAAAPLRSQPAARPTIARRPGRRTSLRLVPPRARRRPRAYGDALFATTLSALLAVGIVGVLLFNTSMQTQADRIQAMRKQVATLSLQLQEAQTVLDRDNSPSALAARATALNMRPARTVTILRLTDLRRADARRADSRPVSARARAAKPSHGG